MKNNRSKMIATLSTFLILVIGTVLNGLLCYYGIFSAWIALLSSAGASACYLKICNKKDAFYYLSTIILSIGLNIGAVCLSLIILYQNKFGVPFSVASDAFGDIVTDNLNAFIINVVFCVLFSIAGIVMTSTIFKNKKSIVRENDSINNGKLVLNQGSVAEEYVKIAEFCLKNYVQFSKIEDAEVRNSKIVEFNKKFFPKFTPEIKQKVLLSLSSMKLSEEQLKAFLLLKLYLK